MPFDPTLPAFKASNSSAQMREQLNSLKDLIDAVPTVTGVAVDSVTTLPPGNPATVGLSLVGSVLHFAFGLPQGDTGSAGPAGPAFANAVVDSVTTLNPGDPASVGVSYDGANVHFSFSIPRGADGNQGNNGSDGAQGPPGEVSNAQLTTAIDGTSSNSNSVATLGLSVSDPPTQAEMQAVADKLDELIAMLRR